MEELFNFVQSKITLTAQEAKLIQKCFVSKTIPAQTVLLKEGQIENYIYYLSGGIVKGYQNIDGKIVVQQLISESNFFTSLESFMHQQPSKDYFETITDCNVVAISKFNFNFLQQETSFFDTLVTEVTHQHLTCKQERVKDFQTLSAKQRYEKFMDQHPKLALQVSIDNIASYLGMEPQSLSRIRKQLTF